MGKPPKQLQVSVLFGDSDVASIFAELLEAQGATVQFLSKPEEISAQTHIVTEPRFFPAVRPEQYGQCLIVGNKEVVKDLPTLSLARPLTEEGVEAALAKLLQ